MIVSVECREGETSLKLKQPGKAGCGAAGLNFLKTPQTLWPGEGEARGPRGRDHVTGSKGAGGRRLEAAAENFKASKPSPAPSTHTEESPGRVYSARRESALLWEAQLGTLPGSCCHGARRVIDKMKGDPARDQSRGPAEVG